jgi:lipopolysaccharide export system permease protein
MIGMTLGAYMFRRFAVAVAASFLVFAALIALVDFVDVFRRVSELSSGSGAEAGLLTAMRLPSIAEQLLPFAVLGGSIFAFVSLSRKMELVVARAAGISVWQFIAPPLLVGALVGILSVILYNPVAALLRQRSDATETALFGHAGGGDLDAGLWIRQGSVDGQAIIRATRSSDGGTVLANVVVFTFGDDDDYKERIEAARARLLPGYWRLENVRIYEPGEAPVTSPSYDLSTNLTPAQVTQSFLDPETVPFWSLPAVVHETEQAGLDATAYRLQYQALLARPLTLVAMVLIAACFSLRFFRFGGIAKTAAGGVAAGFVLYVAQKVISDLGGAGLLSAPTAAWSPAVVASMLGALFLLHQEDG